MTRCLPYGPRCPAAVVERSLPSGRAAGHVRAVGVRVADDQVEHLERTLLIREMPPSSRRLAEPGVRALDRVRGVDDLADLRREPEERGELLPRDAPEPNDRRIPLAPLRLELGESGLGRIDGRCRVDRARRPVRRESSRGSRPRTPRIDAIQWLVLPGHALIDDLVGDPLDQLP